MTRGKVARTFAALVRQGELDECITFLEDQLRAAKTSPFTPLLGATFLAQVKPAADYITRFYRAASEECEVRALYFEMNEFSINTDYWYFSGFAYANEGAANESDWLAYPQVTADEEVALDGMTSVRGAFRDLMMYEEDPPRPLRTVAEVADYLVTARFMQLIAAGHATAQKTCRKLEGLPVLSTAHERDVFHRSV